MTDQEVICTWMEPDAPENGGTPNQEILKKFSSKGWWRYYSMLSCLWKQPILDTCAAVEKLGRLREVEARLTEEQQWQYIEALRGKFNRPTWHFLHASAELKIAALASVLRQQWKMKDEETCR